MERLEPEDFAPVGVATLPPLKANLAKRSRTRAELVKECCGILYSALNSSDLTLASAKLADLLIELTGNTGTVAK